ncbi:MAG: RpiB/LacA/LacB family sugar-phosphate isomerase [Mycoplasmataceae bacterium]|jgi:galactose-6-phosphate isomerase|nr:RpiB/LacA/LacB family sugar-phosphate isomerase [Mycoplasmataceae bacterium]
MKIGLISDIKNLTIIKELAIHINKSGHKAVMLNCNDDLIKNANSLRENLQLNKVERGIAVDDFGIAPFMYLSKFENIVVAEITDEHSSRMTCEHNNATVLSFGSNILTIYQMKKLITAFLNAEYEGGRHKVRIDMMNTLAKNGE